MMILEGPKGGQMVAYRVHDSWAGIAHDISNEVYTENRCSGSNTSPTVALQDVIAMRGSAFSPPPTSRLVAQECNTVTNFPGSTQAGSWQENWNPGGRQVWQLDGFLGHHTDKGWM